jgi:hypothetical protein
VSTRKLDEIFVIEAKLKEKHQAFDDLLKAHSGIENEENFEEELARKKQAARDFIAAHPIEDNSSLVLFCFAFSTQTYAIG